MIDVLELQLLSQLQAKREAEARVQSQQAWGVRALAAGVNRVAGLVSSTAPTTTAAPDPSTNGTTTSSPFDIHAPGAIQNRSPITNNHYYNATPPVAPGPVIIEPPAPSPQPVKPGLSPLWLLAIPLLIGAGLLAWYLRPKPAPPTPPPTWSAAPSVIFSEPR